MMSLKRFKSLKIENEATANLLGGLGGDNGSNEEQSFEYYWTHIGDSGGWTCATQDSRAYDDCGGGLKHA